MMTDSQLAITRLPNTNNFHYPPKDKNIYWCLYENIIDFCLYLWLSFIDYRVEVAVYGPFYWALDHCSYLSLVLLKVPLVPDVVLWLVILPGEIASRALAGDFDHGELFTVASEITGRLAWTGVCTVLLLLCYNTTKKSVSTDIERASFSADFLAFTLPNDQTRYFSESRCKNYICNKVVVFDQLVTAERAVMVNLLQNGFSFTHPDLRQ